MEPVLTPASIADEFLQSEITSPHDGVVSLSCGIYIPNHK